ncbi:MAG: OsmC family protein [Deltaproteobacteria bacterium]|nr:OsmC family protein [Deltaproteobacteria bacterium]
MAKSVEAQATLTNEMLQFTGTVGDNPEIIFNYPPPMGDGPGYNPLELLLMSLAVCSSTASAILLRGMKKTVSGVSVHAQGTLRKKPPTSFEKVVLEFTFTSSDATDHDVQQAIRLAEETYCPVWAMLKNSIEIASTCTVITPEECLKSA